MSSLISKGNPSLRLAFDATALKEAVCLRKYYYGMVQGYRNSSVDTDFGSFFHYGRETFDKEFHATNGDVEASLLEAIKATLIQSHGWEREGADKAKTRRTLIRGLIWAVEDLGTNLRPIVLPSGKLAVELSFVLPLDLKSPYGEDYLICGYLDGLTEYEGAALVIERKTTKTHVKSKQYAQQFNPDTQTSMYALASDLLYGRQLRTAGVLVESFQTGVGFARFRRLPIRKTEAQNAEFLHSVKYDVSRIERAAETGDWPVNHSACNLFGGCKFREICALPPSLRESFLKGKFERKEIWDPLKIR